jgi:bifunctional DNA-binding transcriptional regulator/antitoxin component of YhaV-PrlF toxin-antitoxin module
MPATATLSSKVRISIPKAVREEQRWGAGQKSVFIAKGRGVLFMPVPNSIISPGPRKAPKPPATATVRTATDGGGADAGR